MALVLVLGLVVGVTLSPPPLPDGVTEELDESGMAEAVPPEEGEALRPTRPALPPAPPPPALPRTTAAPAAAPSAAPVAQAAPARQAAVSPPASAVTPARPPAAQVALLPPPAPPRPDAAPAPDGVPAWQRNAVPAAPADGRPRIVIVIDDMGLDRRRSGRVVSLPGPLTLAWLPYARDLPEQTRQAHRHGHELIVHMPMEPAGGVDPGPDALLVRQSPEEILSRLRANLNAFSGYVGINNHMGSRFTADAAASAVVVEELARRGLLVLDSRTTADSRLRDEAVRRHVPSASRDVFLDHVQTPAAVATALEKVEATARRQGLAIAIGHPHDVTTEALARWLPTLAGKGFQLVPLSAVVRAGPPNS